MKKYAILTLLCFLIGSRNICFAQQGNMDAYCLGFIVAMGGLSEAPDEDDYKSVAAYNRDSAVFYADWADGMQTLGLTVGVPQSIREEHYNIVKSAKSLSQAFRGGNAGAIAIAEAALGVAILQMGAKLDE